MPPEIPRAPKKPNVALVLVAAAIAGFFLAVFGAVAADLRTGVVLERWQVERLLPDPKTVVQVRFP
jgi:hypothetical protein